MVVSSFYSLSVIDTILTRESAACARTLARVRLPLIIFSVQPNETILPHFHGNTQFQIFPAGSGVMG
jgi:hypothetical protein